MIDLTIYKILKFTYPYSTDQLGEVIWDKMNDTERKWAVKLTLESIAGTGELDNGSYDIFFLEEKLQSRIENMLNKYDVPYVITDETHVLLENPDLLDDDLIKKLDKYLEENIKVDDVLDRIIEVGMDNITPFEKYYLKNNKENIEE
jgi:type III secretory pathway component EscV